METGPYGSVGYAAYQRDPFLRAGGQVQRTFLLSIKTPPPPKRLYPHLGKNLLDGFC